MKELCREKNAAELLVVWRNARTATMNRPRPDQLSGYTIRGYKVEQLLGIGQLTAVYRVRNSQDETRMLTVIIAPDRFTKEMNEHFLLRFDHLAPTLSSLKHPHIVPLLGWGQQEGYPYLLLPDISGRSIAQELRAHGPFSLAYAVAILERVAEGIESAHGSGILHLGLSTARIFLTEDAFVQIAGFGLVALLTRQDIEEVPGDPYSHLRTVAGTFMEQPEYLAPEIVQGAAASTRTDVYALGILLYEMLSGHPPFEGNTYLEVAQKHVHHPLPPLHAQRTDVPLAFELVLHQALKRDPDQRFKHPRDLSAACMRVLTRRSFSLISRSQDLSQYAPVGQNHENISDQAFPSPLQGAKRNEQEIIGQERGPSKQASYFKERQTRHEYTRQHPSPEVLIQVRENERQTATGDFPTQEKRVALLDVLELLSLPPSERKETVALVPVPASESESGLSIRGVMEEILDELLSRSPMPGIRGRRRRFRDMFPYT